MGVLSASFTVLTFVLKPIINSGSFVARRGFRFWWSKKSPDEKKFLRSQAFRNLDKFASGFAVTSMAIWYWYERHTRVCPITGRKQFVFLTENQVRDIANIVRHGLERSFAGKLLPSEDQRAARIKFIVQHIMEKNSNIPELNCDWKVHVIDNRDWAHSIVLPMGEVFVFTGLWDFCENYDQMAIVLAHDIAHTILDHQAEDLSNQHLEVAQDLIIATPLTMACSRMPQNSRLTTTCFQKLFAQYEDIYLSRPYNRSMEREADRVGLFLASNACVDLDEALILYNMAEKAKSLDKHSSLHPIDNLRLELIARTVPIALTSRNRSCGSDNMQSLVEAHFNQNDHLELEKSPL